MLLQKLIIFSLLFLLHIFSPMQWSGLTPFYYIVPGVSSSAIIAFSCRLRHRPVKYELKFKLRSLCSLL